MAFVRCDCGRDHWGRYGAAGVLLLSPDRDQVLLQLRSARVLNPHTWALPGGALERGETPSQAAVRETAEETGLAGVVPEREIAGLVHPQWRYTYVLATATTLDLPDHRSWEASAHRWYPLTSPPQLHPELAKDWSRLLGELGG